MHVPAHRKFLSPPQSAWLMALALHIGLAQAQVQTSQLMIWPQQDLTLVGAAQIPAKQTMLWAQRPRLGLDLAAGLGVEQKPRWPSSPAPGAWAS